MVLVGKVASVPDSHKNAAISKTVLGRPPPIEYCKDSRLKHTPSIPVKKAYYVEALA